MTVRMAGMIRNTVRITVRIVVIVGITAIVRLMKMDI